ncbi:hypothetical protein VTP01DRAFT_4049 [Rhizomucor pusillus]|uniref:uncharacterized protein n=1 Tax=Rhizomucor pusillus TaxID=4840 RepID=UPI003742D76F
MCLLRDPKEKAIGTVYLQTLSALPRMHIRYWVLQTKFALRARTLPPDTLVACVIPQLPSHEPGDRPHTSTAVLWEGVEKLMQADIDKLVNTPDKFVAVKRGLRRPVWDPILSLPCNLPTGAEAIDTALNLLPSKVPSNLGRWKTLWPALLLID